MRAIAVTAGALIGFGVGFVVAALTVPEWAPLLVVVGAGLGGVLLARLVPRSPRTLTRRQERDQRVRDFRR